MFPCRYFSLELLLLLALHAYFLFFLLFLKDLLVFFFLRSSANFVYSFPSCRIQHLLTTILPIYPLFTLSLLCFHTTLLSWLVLSVCNCATATISFFLWSCILSLIFGIYSFPTLRLPYLIPSLSLLSLNLFSLILFPFPTRWFFWIIYRRSFLI